MPMIPAHVQSEGRKPRNGRSGRGLIVARRPRALPLLFVVGAVGCGAGIDSGPAPIPTPIGKGSRFTPGPLGSAGEPQIACTRGRVTGAYRVHLELFARKRAMVIPARVGIQRDCRYPIRTLTPTGVLELDHPDLTLGDFFAVWRMPLSQHQLLSFRGSVTAYVAGKRWRGDVAMIPLRDRAQIVVEAGGYIPPHRFYLFPSR